MAGKWKIAKAFGEAAAKMAKKGKGIPESVEGAALEHVDFSTNKPFDDVGRAFNEGVNRGNRESWTVRYGSDNGKTAVERFNTEEEARKFYDDHYGADGIDFLEEPALESGAKPRSNQLQKDFDEAFDEAVKTHTKEDPNRGKFTEEEVRGEAIDMLKGGAKIEDVFDFLRGKIDYVKMKD